MGRATGRHLAAALVMLSLPPPRDVCAWLLPPSTAFTSSLQPLLHAQSNANRFTRRDDSREYSTPSIKRPWRRLSCASRCSGTVLLGGVGTASDYSWREEQFEIEVTVKVPEGTRAGDVKFRCSPTGADLRVRRRRHGGGDSDESVEEEMMLLLDGTRKMRGRICMDGTYWAIADAGGGREGDGGREREVTVTIEKHFPSPRDQFEITDFDWGGVYPDDEEEVSQREYDEPEELDVREYAATLGVDIDNINMSLVDKTMFSSGINMTRSTLEQLTEAGYAQEVTRQADGTEYVATNGPSDDETGGIAGGQERFNAYGEGIGISEVREAERSRVPFIDTPSPWTQSIPAEEAWNSNGEAGAGAVPIPSPDGVIGAMDETGADTVVSAKDNTVQRIKKTVEEKKREGKPSGKAQKKTGADHDPIDRLTVARLKEILREQNLKVSGSKKELQERLRAHVDSIMLKEDKDAESGTHSSLGM